MHSITVIELVGKAGLWVALFWVGSLKSLFCYQCGRNIYFEKTVPKYFLKIEASVGLPQRRSVPRKDQSAERGGCREESSAEIAAKMY